MESLRQTVTNDPAAASVVRGRLRNWLTRAGWPPMDTDDLVTAVSEAVSNSIEHAYPAGNHSGVIVVRADRRVDDHDYRILVTVTDDGRWRPQPHDPGYRGRGIAMMHEFTDWVGIDADTSGTTVRLLSRAVGSITTTTATPATLAERWSPCTSGRLV